MTQEQELEYLLLQYRECLANMERDNLWYGGEWRCDWAGWAAEIRQKIDAIKQKMSEVQP